MRLHLLALPHTITAPDRCHCAFTGKILRFSPMLRSRGFHVTHYGVEGATSGADVQVDVMARDEQEALLGAKFDPASPAFFGDSVNVNGPLYRLFNARLRIVLRDTVKPGDVVCHPFGTAHLGAVDGMEDVHHLETGIGYTGAWAANRVYESEAWRHWHLGRAHPDRAPTDYEWVIPNYYDLAEWEPSYARGSYLLFFGRICADKGLQIVVEIAGRRPDLRVVICGQGDPKPWLLAPNIEYTRPVYGRARCDLLRGALATLCPSRYVEPFCGTAVESMLCGTPVLASSFGAFTETIRHGVTGYRCRTLGDWLAAVERVEAWGAPEREQVRAAAASQWDMHKIAHEYEAVLEQLADLPGAGWYTQRSRIGPSERAQTGPHLEPGDGTPGAASCVRGDRPAIAT